MKAEAREVGKGYDDVILKEGDRIELHPGMDLWMQGARYGKILDSSTTTDGFAIIRVDKLRSKRFIIPVNRLRKVK